MQSTPKNRQKEVRTMAPLGHATLNLFKKNSVTKWSIGVGGDGGNDDLANVSARIFSM